jgi:hypothetical protein
LRAPDFTNGLSPANRYLYDAMPVSGRPAVCVPALISICSRPPYPSRSVMGCGSVLTSKVFGDQMVVYADGFYQRVNTHNELAAPATVRSKQRVRRYWLFRRIRRLRQARNHPTRPLTRRPVSRLTHSILLIPSSKLSPAARARVWLNLGTVCSITKLTHG